MSVKQPKLLFFINGPVPNADNNAEANGYRGKGAVVMFRNAQRADDADGAPEKADGVLGDVPAKYKDQPSADAALETYRKAVEEDQRKYAEAAEKMGAVGNLGGATTAHLASVPVAAPVRDGGLPENKQPFTPAAPTSPNYTTVGTENLGAKANVAGQPNPPVPQQPGPTGQPVAGADGATAQQAQDGASGANAGANLTKNPFA